MAADAPSLSAGIAASFAASDLVSEDPAVTSEANGAQISTLTTRPDALKASEAPREPIASDQAATRVGPPESSYGEVVTVTISGRFVTPDGAPASGVKLEAEAMYGDGPGLLGEITTGPSGSFTFNVETARTFRIIVRPASGFVLGTITQQGTVLPGSGWGEGQWVLEPVASTATLGDITLIAGHVVSGKVTVTGPLSPTDATLSLLSGAATFDVPIRVQTGSTTWTATVPSGDYRAQVSSYQVGIAAWYGGSSPETASLITVGAAVPDVDFSVSVTSRTISGTVRDASGQPVDGAQVSSSPESWGDNSGRSTITAVDGTYTLVNVVPGTYVLSFYAGGAPVYWRDADDYDAAERIQVMGATGSLTGYDVVVKAGVRITGTVTNPDGTPRAGDHVEFVKGTAQFGSAVTAADGTYSSYALPAGDYTVSIRQGGSEGLQQWYDGKRSAADADLVRAGTDSEVYDGIDFVAVTGGTITGKVGLPDGAPVEGATVSVFAAHNTSFPVGVVTTDAQGEYSVSGLGRENYVVQVTSGSSGVMDAWFGAIDIDSAPAVIELGLDETFRADITTRLGATVRGIVTGIPAGQSVSVQLSRMDAMGWRSISVSSTDGGPVTWEVSGLEGTWVADVDGRYWQGGVEIIEATAIELTPGQVFEGVDFDLLAGATVTGVVTTSDGSQIGRMDYTVQRRAEDDRWEWVQVPNRGAAAFAFALAPGDYRVRTSGTTTSGEALRDTVTEFVVVADEKTELSITTRLGWAVSGTLTDAATGDPAGGVQVVARADDASSASIGYSRVDGSYRVIVGAVGGWTISAGEDSASYAPSTRTVTIDGADLSGISISLRRGAQISGMLTAENTGNALPWINVQVQDQDGAVVASASSMTDGRYRTPALPSGTYLVRFTNWSGLYVEQWWQGATDAATATAVDVADEGISGIDAALKLGGVVTGAVTDSDGAALAGATVGLATLPAAGMDALLAPLAEFFGDPRPDPILGIEATTDESGAYTLPPVDPGSYALYVYTPSTGTTWYDGKSTLSAADSVQVLAGVHTPISLRLRGLADGESPRTPEQSITDDFAIQLHPHDSSVIEGETASFRAVASGSSAPSVQWQQRKPGEQSFSDIPGETDTRLYLVPTREDSGTAVRAVFTLGGDNLTTDAATLDVTSQPVAPSQPEAPVASKIEATTVQFSWAEPEAGGSPITGYTVRLYIGSNLVREVGASSTSLVLTGLTAQTAYSATVSAVNSIGAGAESAKASFTTKVPVVAPGAPTGVSAVAGDGRAVVSWKAPASTGGAPITGYTVKALPGGATVSTSGATTGTVTGLANGRAYTFTVTATNMAGASATSGPSAAVTPKAPATAVGVSRQSGLSRWETAVAVSKATFPSAGVPV
ncbi:carboxypeptidase regulatory-like domain-containing protein, partial [Microbacterium phyllosphaerae]|uniref:carboxypeptidase regulatory-like domain-containing protein n=1 Tax=Microbacterium phyllosphaerae TaxID=124798 RepID=UPI002166E510